NGHAFGAGLMLALCHDVRLMREDRGFACANEMQIGFRIPTPELALFRHKLSASAFFETVQLARRWTGPDALAAGIVQAVAGPDTLEDAARARAEALAPLGANRALYGEQKERLFGENAVLDGPHGAAHMLRHSADFA
ncbi:MAG: enoyl-CoA hydratase-related protein, partial [Pseudomonadales bacterium]